MTCFALIQSWKIRVDLLTFRSCVKMVSEFSHIDLVLAKSNLIHKRGRRQHEHTWKLWMFFTEQALVHMDAISRYVCIHFDDFVAWWSSTEHDLPFVVVYKQFYWVLTHFCIDLICGNFFARQLGLTVHVQESRVPLVDLRLLDTLLIGQFEQYLELWRWKLLVVKLRWHCQCLQFLLRYFVFRLFCIISELYVVCQVIRRRPSRHEVHLLAEYLVDVAHLLNAAARIALYGLKDLPAFAHGVKLDWPTDAIADLSHTVSNLTGPLLLIVNSHQRLVVVPFIWHILIELWLQVWGRRFNRCWWMWMI